MPGSYLKLMLAQTSMSLSRKTLRSLDLISCPRSPYTVSVSVSHRSSCRWPEVNSWRREGTEKVNPEVVIGDAPQTARLEVQNLSHLVKKKIQVVCGDICPHAYSTTALREGGGACQEGRTMKLRPAWTTQGDLSLKWQKAWGAA